MQVRSGSLVLIGHDVFVQLLCRLLVLRYGHRGVQWLQVLRHGRDVQVCRAVHGSSQYLWGILVQAEPFVVLHELFLLVRDDV